MQPRKVESLVKGRETTDGAGVHLTRVITSKQASRLDPFLMLDVFRSDQPQEYIGGFPNHPHRGFETVTYMIVGRMRHQDSGGNTGHLGPGAAQWMVAGSGLIHSEFPEQEAGLLEGFQLWLNLPAKNKMTPPAYRDIPAERIPEATLAGGVRLRVIAGECAGIPGAVSRPDTEPVFADIHLPAGGVFKTALPLGHNAFVYVYRGEIQFAGQTVRATELAILANEGEGVVIAASQAAQVILVAGRPLGEPVVQHGPFVMNTAEQIEEALADYRAGRFSSAKVTAF
jgi:redox-sensitive bicupin YhaK (pirin superfamily)